MKKFFAGIAAAAIITVPMTSFALESMSKGALKKATGQAGVSIAIDDIVIYKKSNPTVTYWDTDGMTKYNANGTDPAVGTTYGSARKTGIQISYGAQAEKVMIIDGILDNTKYSTTFMAGITGAPGGSIATNDLIPVVGIAASTSSDSLMTLTGGTDYADPGNGTYNGGPGNYVNGISPLTIDVGTCESLSKGLSWNLGESGALAAAIPQVAGVIIGLPTVEIQTFHKDNIQSISLVTPATGKTGAPTGAVVNTGKEFISIEKSGHSTMAILGGRIEIAPH